MLTNPPLGHMRSIAYFWDVENPAAYNNRMGHYKTRRESELIQSYITVPGRRILDVGGGSGRFAIPLHEAGHDLRVIDLNAEAIRLLRLRCPQIVSETADFMSWDPQGEGSFDLVLAMEMLLYVKDWPAFFAKVHSMLSPGGVVLFTATNRSSWRTMLERVKSRLARATDYHYSIFTPRQYDEIVREAGFEIDRVEGFLWCPCTLSSDNPLVDVCAWMEKTLGLVRFTAQSPWLFYAIRKQS